MYKLISWPLAGLRVEKIKQVYNFNKILLWTRLLVLLSLTQVICGYCFFFFYHNTSKLILITRKTPKVMRITLMVKTKQYTVHNSLHTGVGKVFIQSTRVYLCVSVSRFGSSLFLDLEELGHVGEIFLVGFGHLLLCGLRIDDFQTLWVQNQVC